MKLRELIANKLAELLFKVAFKSFVAEIAAETPVFDPDAEQENLTAEQEAWIEEVVNETLSN